MLELQEAKAAAAQQSKQKGTAYIILNQMYDAFSLSPEPIEDGICTTVARFIGGVEIIP